MSDLLRLPFVVTFAAIMLVLRIPIGIVLLLAGPLGFSLIRGPTIPLDPLRRRPVSVCPL